MPQNAKLTMVQWGNGWFGKLALYPRRMTNVNNAKWKFNLNCWEDIAKMNKLDLFQMCWPEQFIIDAVIPEMNKNF